MAHSTYGRDANLCAVEEIADDQRTIGWALNTSSTSLVTLKSWTPAAPPADNTKYICVWYNLFYHDNSGGRGIIEFHDGTTVVDQIEITPPTSLGGDWRTGMCIAEVTLPSTGMQTLYIKGRVTNASHTLYGNGGGIWLLPRESFADDQFWVSNGQANLTTPYPTTYTDFVGAASGSLQWTPDQDGDYFVLGYAAMAGGSTTCPVWVTLNVDGTQMMEAESVFTGGFGANKDQYPYLWSGIVSLSSAAQVTIKFQGKRSNNLPGRTPFLYHQAIFAGRLSGTQDRIIAHRGIVAAKNRIVTS